MECAAKGRGMPCCGPAVRPCARCGAVAYCSLSHQISHWSDHKEECQRLEEQMLHADELNDFPFTFYEEATFLKRRKPDAHFWPNGVFTNSECGLMNVLVHLQATPMLSLEAYFMAIYCGRLIKCWHLPSTMCPCIAPLSLLPRKLNCWEKYYEWRRIPLDSPVALLLHWPLTIYHTAQLICLEKMKLESDLDISIHYLGPDKEISQLAVFGELKALFPYHKVHIELIGPGVPEHRDGETINLDNYAQCSDASCRCRANDSGIDLKNCNDRSPAVTLHLSKGLYHECFMSISKFIIHSQGTKKRRLGAPQQGRRLTRLKRRHWEGALRHTRRRSALPFFVTEFDYNRPAIQTPARSSSAPHSSVAVFSSSFLQQYNITSFPDLIIAANAGIAAYPSWAPTIEMIGRLNVPAVFTDFCEEAAHLAAKCLNSITRRELRIPIQLNPFRQPMVVEDGALCLPCYSNCFIFGI
ncbi:hypothetical protein V2J09_004193 [Rumex salicifolius]